MPPTNSRDVLKAAAQRLNAAEALFAADFTLDAQYVGGYTIEFSFKALILDKTPEADRLEKLLRITRGARMHETETLLQELRTLGVTLTPHLAKRIRRFDWAVSLRYEVGRRNRGETRGLLRTCAEIYKWVEGELQ